MSQILIISDSHYLRKHDLISFIDQFQDIEAVIHCGDIYLGYEPGEINKVPFYICRGNNDFANLPRILNFEIKNVRFTIIHGHINSYAYQPTHLKDLLEEYPADVICFGHTHVPYFYQDKDIMILNPGSLSLGRSYPRRNTYILFDTETMTPHFYDIENNQEIVVENQND